MQADVNETVVPARYGCRRHPRWIRGHSGDPILAEQRIDFVGEPRLVSGLQHRASFETPAQLTQKLNYDWLVERKTGRQLNQNRPALAAKTRGLFEELVEPRLCIDESLFVGDHLGQLYRETEPVWH